MVMMKRKSQEAVSPGTTVVMTSPSNPSIFNRDDTSSPFSILSPFSPSASRSWEDTRDSMDKLLLQFEGPNASNEIAVLKDNMNIIKKLEENVGLLKTKSNKIKEEIQSRIDDSMRKLEEETEALRFQQDCVNEKRSEVDKMKREIAELIKKEMELKMKIEQHKEDASQEVEDLDEVEEEKKAEVFRLQQHISLLALVSGIKWDYDSIDTIAGEVEIPSKKKHIRFEIDKDQHTPFEIAHMLWTKIGS